MDDPVCGDMTSWHYMRENFILKCNSLRLVNLVDIEHQILNAFSTSNKYLVTYMQKN